MKKKTFFWRNIDAVLWTEENRRQSQNENHLICTTKDTVVEWMKYTREENVTLCSSTKFIAPTQCAHRIHTHTHTWHTNYVATTKWYLCNMSKGLVQFSSVELCDLLCIQLKSPWHERTTRRSRRRKESEENEITVPLEMRFALEGNFKYIALIFFFVVQI